jgi:hypothetical protein
MPRPQPAFVPDTSCCTYLDHLREELQAMSAFGPAVQVESAGKCCSNARAGTEIDGISHELMSHTRNFYRKRVRAAADYWRGKAGFRFKWEARPGSIA